MAELISHEPLKEDSYAPESGLPAGQGQWRTDHLGVRKWHVCSWETKDRLCQSREFPAGRVPGATDGSMPVGSGQIIY
jgi:hypothetical protein